MEVDCRFIPRTSSVGPRRPAASRCARVRRGDLVGAAQRRSVEGLAGALPLSSHLLATLPGLDRGRRVDEGLGKTAANARSRGTHPVGRRDRRRNVLLGEKRGLSVGKTKCGKGTKTMVLTDGRGL